MFVRIMVFILSVLTALSTWQAAKLSRRPDDVVPKGFPWNLLDKTLVLSSKPGIDQRVQSGNERRRTQTYKWTLVTAAATLAVGLVTLMG